ncbi:Hypothetical protein SMAX5B_021909 [Scophthalmus maximus]|uniref:Uncharacterized protein n=1 Tax=Scophthalmus maximus TaxID=52904 RepID=A0A2U9CKK1_SCOMX|nr:Hypothetical protein SMAX5B_021909 [Scophthalmus maximus]KAF0044126.1 hypothetical protein F2P81_003284 [Scophthalmus maximus]
MQFKSVADTFLSAAEEERKDQRSDRRGRVRARANGENVAKLEHPGDPDIMRVYGALLLLPPPAACSAPTPPPATSLLSLALSPTSLHDPHLHGYQSKMAPRKGRLQVGGSAIMTPGRVKK